MTNNYSGSPKIKIGFIGAGLMGVPMVKRLLLAGYSTHVWNRTRERVLPLLKLGAIEEKRVSDLVQSVQYVFLCLTDTEAVEEVVFGKDGVASSIGKGKMLVDFSSIRPDQTREFAVRLNKLCGMEWVDAPVSGGVNGAVHGTLALLVGGTLESYERIKPIVSCLCSRSTHMGPIGSGQIAKLCNQVIVATNLVAIAEAVNLADRSGVDASKLHEALSGGFADSIPLQIFGPRFAKIETQPLLGNVSTMLKDVDSARNLGVENGAPLPMSTIASELLRQIASRGYSDKDITNLIRLFSSKEDNTPTD